MKITKTKREKGNYRENVQNTANRIKEKENTKPRSKGKSEY